MKTATGIVSVYLDESVILIAEEQELNKFCTWIACALNEAADNAKKENRHNTANSYLDLRDQFINIRSKKK